LKHLEETSSLEETSAIHFWSYSFMLCCLLYQKRWQTLSSLLLKKMS